VSRFTFIHAQRAQYAIRRLCRTLEVSPSGYYAWRGRAPSAREQENARLLTAAQRVHRESRETYGSPRLQQALVRLGYRCGRHRVARLMRQAGLRGLPRRKFVRTTQRVTGAPQVPDRLERDFSAAAANQKWVSDITYIRTGEGWLYLATVIDLYSRRVVGWAMAAHMRAELVLAALRMAHAQRGAPQDLIYHSDHGGQYTSSAVQEWLAHHKIRASMGSTGDCFDNAVAESFYATLKRECVHRQTYATRAQARTHIFEFIEVFYNRQRLHSTLGYQSPVDYEQRGMTP
jgi:putative transposase